MEELCTAIHAHVSHCTVPKKEIQALRTDIPDVFLSYSWKNSYLAKEDQQIQSVVGNVHTDPRLIKRELERAIKKNIWLDVERLGASNNSSSMFEQMAVAINASKVVVCCISQEYAMSDNCRMEIQFAALTLKKRVIAVIVGEGAEWKSSAVGIVVSKTDKQISFQENTSSLQFADKLKQLGALVVDAMDFTNSKRSLKKKPHKKKVMEKAVGQASTFISAIGGVKQLTKDYAMPKQHGTPSKKNKKKTTTVPIYPDLPPPPAPPLELAQKSSDPPPWTPLQSSDPKRSDPPPPYVAPPAGSPPPYVMRGGAPIPIDTSANNYLTIKTFNDDIIRLDFDGKWQDVATTTTINTLKIRVKDKLGIPPSQQRLCLSGGRELRAGGKTLKDESIRNKTELNLMFKMSNMNQTGQNPFETSHADDDDAIEEEEDDNEDDASCIVDDDDLDRTEYVMDEIRAPEVGDPVVCRYEGTMFFTAKIVSIDTATLNYTVDWDDGDAQNRVHRYDDVALNMPPNESLVGIGSHVYFQQGIYLIYPTDPTSTAKRWHKGRA